jgi:hypothetical protein
MTRIAADHIDKRNHLMTMHPTGEGHRQILARNECVQVFVSLRAHIPPIGVKEGLI